MWRLSTRKSTPVIVRAQATKGEGHVYSEENPMTKMGKFFVKWMMVTTHLRNQNELHPSSL
jgi:hypothetical protein